MYDCNSHNVLSVAHNELAFLFFFSFSWMKAFWSTTEVVWSTTLEQQRRRWSTSVSHRHTGKDVYILKKWGWGVMIWFIISSTFLAMTWSTITKFYKPSHDLVRFRSIFLTMTWSISTKFYNSSHHLVHQCRVLSTEKTCPSAPYLVSANQSVKQSTNS